MNALYVGAVTHRRLGPRPHAFAYPIFQVFLDLGEVERAFPEGLLWSLRRPALAGFRRRDYLGDPDLPLDEAVRRLVEERTGWRPMGSVCFLGHVRTWGHYFSPVNFYYCFDQGADLPAAIVAEVVNTPWGERHCYVLRQPAHRIRPPWSEFRLTKAFHVSPFLPMDLDYRWCFTPPGATLGVRMESYRGGEKVFEAGMWLTRREATGRALARALLRYSPQTLKVLGWIYFQAFRLWLKRTPFFVHPAKDPAAARAGQGSARA